MQKKKKLIIAGLLIVAVAVAVGVSLSVSRNNSNASDSSKPVAASTNDNEKRQTSEPYLAAHLPALETLIPTDLASNKPTASLTSQPSASQTSMPTTAQPALQTAHPTTLSTPAPSSLPSTPPTTLPSTSSTGFPTRAPSITNNNVGVVTQRPSTNLALSSVPTITFPPIPVAAPVDYGHDQFLSQQSCNVTIFYAIADVPYTSAESLALPSQVLSLPDNAEFLIHLGDIRSAVKENDCVLSDYRNIASILKMSRVPVFLIPGDNEWNDCKNIDKGWKLWQQELSNFEDHWEHDFKVVRPADRPENFAFIHKNTLFIGLNLVGGRVHNQTEWTTRLSGQARWTTGLMKAHTSGVTSVQVRAIVIFGHANPSSHHNSFFLPLKFFIRDELAADIPVLYLNGDAHLWSYNSSFYDVSQLLRIQLTGGTTEPPLQVIVAPSDDAVDNFAEGVFLYDRRL